VIVAPIKNEMAKPSTTAGMANSSEPAVTAL
jgi:hypothetical protein